MRDRDVRAAVLTRLDGLHAGEVDTRVVQEMGIWAGSVRVDIAVINGELHGFELKSERDTLERLPVQASLYSQVFDRVTLVVAEKHAVKAATIIPDWWGVLLASGTACQGVSLRDDRQADRNPTAHPVQIARLLWRAEALDVLYRHGLEKGVRSKTVEVMAQRLAAELTLDVLRDEVRAALKGRIGWLGKVVPDHGCMPIEADAYPISTAACTANPGLGGDGLNAPITPAWWDLPKERMCS